MFAAMMKREVPATFLTSHRLNSTMRREQEPRYSYQ
jgi:hypothetical protein